MLPLAAAATARAHGGSPRVVSVSATEAGEPVVLRLDEGLALRRDDAFEYLCPTRWGDEDSAGPAMAIAGDAVVVSGAAGLWLLDVSSGTLRAHPDPQASLGTTLSLRPLSDGVLQLRLRAELTELVRVDAASVSVVHTEVGAWDALDVEGDVAVLARLTGGQLETLRLSPAGPQRASAPAPQDAVAVSVRFAAGRAHLAVLTGGGLSAQLGLIEGGDFRVLHAAGDVIVGPVVVDGATLLAAEGQLARLDDDAVVAVPGDEIVTCLGRHGELAYACTARGLHRLHPDGLGERLFDLATLRPADTSTLEPALAERCELQWQRYLLDLRAAGIDVQGAAASDSASASAAADAGAARQGPPAADAGAPRASHGGGCRLPPAARAGDGPAAPVAASALSLSALVLLRRRRRGRGPARAPRLTPPGGAPR